MKGTKKGTNTGVKTHGGLKGDKSTAQHGSLKKGK